jgi:hypothetical protein
MIAAERYISTAAIRRAVGGRELDILAALGIQCCGSQHIHCPYPDHADKDPSWRWDAEKKRAFCTCTRSDSIFDVICKVKGVGFEVAKIMAAEMIGRTDLIRDRRSQRYGSATATQLRNPPADNRDDALAWKYLAHRLDIQPPSKTRSSRSQETTNTPSVPASTACSAATVRCGNWARMHAPSSTSPWPCCANFRPGPLHKRSERSCAAKLNSTGVLRRRPAFRLSTGSI